MTASPPIPHVGGFADLQFLEAVHRHHPVGEWMVVVGDDLLVPAVFDDGLIRFVGHEDLIDYRAVRGDTAVVELSRLMVDTGHALLVDSLPSEAAELVEEAAVAAGRSPRLAPHTTTARLDVSDGFDGYLANLRKKERHELRRKRRRFEEELGPATLRRESEAGFCLDEFVRLHREADGQKGQFMTDAMVAYFADVLALSGWHVDALVDAHGRVAAAAFGFEDASGYYLYNSGYDTHLRHVSPGIVLLGLLIESAADGPGDVFDFLKGDETYKYRLGATSRQLYTVTA